MANGLRVGREPSVWLKFKICCSKDEYFMFDHLFDGLPVRRHNCTLVPQISAFSQTATTEA